MISFSTCIFCEKELPNSKFSVTQRRKKRKDNRTCKDCVIELNEDHACNYEEFVTEFSSKKSRPNFNIYPFDICYVNFKQLSDELCNSYINIQYRKCRISPIVDITKLICNYYNNQKDKNFIFQFFHTPDRFSYDYDWHPKDGKLLEWISDKRKEDYWINVDPRIDKTICLPLKKIGLKLKLLDVSSCNTWSIYVVQWKNTDYYEYIHKTARTRDEEIDLYQK
eukprot:UN09657